MFAKPIAKKISVMPLQQIFLFPLELLSWAAEGCQNVIPSKICDIITGLAQQEHFFLNICSHII